MHNKKADIRVIEKSLVVMMTLFLSQTLCASESINNNCLDTSTVNAQNHPKLIREDRYWEYEALRVGDSYSLTMKFDGTVKLFGKEYRLFTQATLPGETGKSKYWKSQDQEFQGTLLREEDGKLYVVNMSQWRDESSRHDTGDNDYQSEEFLLYDFNCDTGDYMSSVVTNFDSEACFYNYFDLLDFYPAKNKISKVDYIDIAGEQCKKYTFEPGYTTNSGEYSFQWPELIEGVGFVDYSILSLPMFLDQPTGGWYDIRLSCVYDGDGNQIYPKPKPNVGVGGLEVDNAVSISLEGDKILLSAESGSFEVSVCTMEGKYLRIYDANDSLTISKADLGKGIYLLTVKSGNRTDTCKIIV